LGSKV